MAVGHSEQRSSDESIHGTIEMHGFFPAGQAVAKLQMQNVNAGQSFGQSPVSYVFPLDLQKKSLCTGQSIDWQELLQ